MDTAIVETVMKWRMSLRLAAMGATLLSLVGMLLIVRPWYLDWGATQAEKRESLPGDSIVAQARNQQTRAISIAAPADVVWSWVAQMGQDRAGFYSYDLLENMVGCEMPRIVRLDPLLQHWKLGDRLWMYPPRKAGGVGQAVLIALEPGRALGFGTRQPGTSLSAPPDGSWSFVVTPIDAHSSRLLFRGRVAGGASVWATAFSVGVFEPAHFAMERRTLVGVKALAEGRAPPSAVEDDLQVILWMLTFAALLVSGILVLAGRRPAWHLVTFAAAGLLLPFLTLVQPSSVIGLPLVTAVLAAVVIGRHPMLSTGRRILGVRKRATPSHFGAASKQRS